jgi:hypothetical protein
VHVSAFPSSIVCLLSSAVHFHLPAAHQIAAVYEALTLIRIAPRRETNIQII